MEKIIYTAPTALHDAPIFLPVNGEIPVGTSVLESADGKRFPAQPVSGGLMTLLTANADETLTLTPVSAKMPVMTLCEEADRITITRDGQTVGGYVWDTDFWKPYFGPVCDDEGHPFTRLDFTTTEHPHHRSVYIAVGDVNGVDAWNERENCGIVRTEKVDEMTTGAVFTSLTAHNLWTDHDMNPLMREKTTYVMYNQADDCRMLDITVTFHADFGDVTFGKTKEAGPLGVRMRDELRADTGSGLITNSRGEKTEAECWGHEAEWCDYSGELDFGVMGVTIFDHPDNERYPTTWHVRDYGLFAANNLYFKGGLTIASGDTLTYRFRILFHRAKLSEEMIAEKYAQYIQK